MPAKVTYKHVIIAAIVALFVAHIASVCWLVRENRALSRRITDVQDASQLFYNELDAAAQQQSLSVLPKEDSLYLAELKIAVPLNETTRSVRYIGSSDTSRNGTGDIRISSAFMTDHSVHVQSCSDMVRLKLEAKPDAYSPSQPLYATVALADGRTLQIYASTTKECYSAWQPITPQAIAEEFKSARSY